MDVDRRAILRMAAAALPARLVMAGAQPASAITSTLSTYMSQAGDRVLPPEVIEKAKHHIIDTFSAMISGSQLAPGRSAIRFARAYGGEKVATVVASTVVCGPIEAALANGVLAHADETDDSFPGGWHPGCNVVPAALAAGEQFNISGMKFLRAAALGYDIGARVLNTLRPGIFNTHKSTHSIGGVFGAAAAITRRNSRPESPPGIAIRNISRKASCSAACPREAGSRPRCW
jgi:2-methylcitrate dehydratase PrpD